jgi:predicted nucleic acid-binding protein
LSGWLLDTNVISELRKPACHAAVRRWAAEEPPERLFLSVVTMAEIRFGIERQSDPSFRSELGTWLDTELRPWFQGRLLAIDEEVMLAWRWMVQRGRVRNHTFSQPDLLLAATAAVHSLVMVTRNVVDFLPAGVPALDPWTGRLHEPDQD